MAVCVSRPEGALAVVVVIQLFVTGLYPPPVFTLLFPSNPPHTIISLPVHTAVCPSRPEGAVVMLVAFQLSVLGSYLPPVFKSTKLLPSPPQTIILLPAH